MDRIVVMCIAAYILIGCSSLREVTPEEISEFETSLNVTPEREYRINLAQPKNKTEKCLIDLSSWQTLERDPFEYLDLTWDGQCKNGFSFGLGKISYRSEGETWIAVRDIKEKGRTELFYNFNKDAGLIQYGGYNNNQAGYNIVLINTALADDNGNIVEHLSSRQWNMKEGISSGSATKKYPKGSDWMFQGTMFDNQSFGISKYKNTRKSKSSAGWFGKEYFQPIGYSVLKELSKSNGNRMNHFYLGENSKSFPIKKEKVILPKVYINRILKASQEGKEHSRKAKQKGIKALEIYNQYSSKRPLVD